MNLNFCLFGFRKSTIRRVMFMLQGDSCWRHCFHFCSFAYVFAHRRKLKALLYWLQAAKELLKLNTRLKCSLGVISNKISSFKKSKISGWQKCQWAYTFFVKFWVFKVAQNSFQEFPRHRFWWVTITTFYQLKLQSWYQKFMVKNSAKGVQSHLKFPKI